MKPRKKGDTSYPFKLRLFADGVSVNLAGSTVTFWMRDALTWAVKIAGGACTITDAANGRITYQQSAADMDTDGEYGVEMKVVKSDGTVAHWPSGGFEPLTIWESIG